MKINTLVGALANLKGTARLIEGYSALSRAERAGITLDQMRILYSDLSKCSDADIKGFMTMGKMLVTGEVVVKGAAFKSERAMIPTA